MVKQEMSKNLILGRFEEPQLQIYVEGDFLALAKQGMCMGDAFISELHHPMLLETIETPYTILVFPEEKSLRLNIFYRFKIRSFEEQVVILEAVIAEAEMEKSFLERMEITRTRLKDNKASFAIARGALSCYLQAENALSLLSVTEMNSLDRDSGVLFEKNLKKYQIVHGPNRPYLKCSDHGSIVDATPYSKHQFVIKDGVLEKYEGVGGDVYIQDGVTKIGERAFFNCKTLNSVIIPKSVKYIGDSAFYGCESLTCVTIPETVELICAGAFKNCSSLTSVKIPDGVRCIGLSTFENCRSLSNVSIPNSVRSISWYAFKNCSNLTAITIPNGVTVLGNGAFSGCSKLKNIILPQNIEEIEDECFSQCIQLEQEIALPAAFSTLGEDSFAGCPITAYNVETGSKKYRSIDGVIFSRTGKKLILYPAGVKRTEYFIPSSVEQIGKNAFKGARNLESVHIPESVKRISRGAFHWSNIDYIEVPKSITKLTDAVFANTYVGVYHPNLVESLSHPIYLGGSPDDLPQKSKSAVASGFLYAIQHGINGIDEYKQDYVEYIKRNKKTYVKRALDDDFLLHFLLEEKLIGQKDIELLLENANKTGRTELTAELLNYQAEHFGKKIIADELPDDDPEFKRTMKIADRQEKIRNQKGIRGLVFVATGCFEHFGKVYANEFAFYGKDMSDLKAFIEALGGIYRSAVSSKTDYLISNDPDSDSAKSRKAKELGIPVITESEFLKMAKGTE